MTMRRVTEILMLAGIVFYVAWDIFAIEKAGSTATISDITLSYLWSHPGLAAVVGALLGHLTWPRRNTWPRWLANAVPIATGLALIAVDVFHLLPDMLPVLPFGVGFMLGHFVWSQKEPAS